MIYRLGCNPSKRHLIKGFAVSEYGLRRLIVERWAKYFLTHESQLDIQIDMERKLVEVRLADQPITQNYPCTYFIHEYTNDTIR